MELTPKETLLLVGSLFLACAIALVILTITIKGWAAYNEPKTPVSAPQPRNVYVDLIKGEIANGNRENARALVKVWWSHLPKQDVTRLTEAFTFDGEKDYIDYKEFVFLSIYPQKQPPCDTM